MASLAGEAFMEVAAATVPASVLRGKQDESSREHDGESKPQADVQQDDPEKVERERTLRSQIASMRRKADLLERQTGDIRAGLDDLLNLVERKDVELAHVEGTIRTLRSQVEDGSATPNSKVMRGVRDLQVEAGGPRVARTIVSSQRPSLGSEAAVDGEQSQESARPRRVVRESSAPTGVRTSRLTPRLASPRIAAAGERRPVPPAPASFVTTTGQECEWSARSTTSLALCEWMRSRAADAQESPGKAQSHACSRVCTPSRQRPKATWSTPCVSCASPVVAPVACWLAPSLLAPSQPHVVVQSSGHCCRDAVPQWPLSVRVPVVTQPLAAWSVGPPPHGATSLMPASPLSSVGTPCSGCAGLRPPPGLASCPLILPPPRLQPPSGLGVPAHP